MEHDIERHELEKRLAIAREFKQSTFGSGHITPEVFGERHDFAAAQYIRKDERNKPRERMSAEERKKRQKVHDFRIRLSRCAIVKEKNGGIVGVYEYFRNRRKPKWHANLVHGKVTFDCAIAAAEARNKSVEQTTPGYDELLCDMNAVWSKWGCHCGRHRRGN